MSIITAPRNRYLAPRFASNRLWRIAGAVPSLHLSPRETGSWRDLISGVDLTTFSRANTSPTYELDGAGGLVAFNSGERAIGYSPETGVRGGSIFGQHTQLLASPYYTAGTNGWTNGVVGTGVGSISPVAISNPLGTTSNVFQVTGLSSTSYIGNFTTTSSSANSNTASIIVKNNTGSRFQIRLVYQTGGTYVSYGTEYNFSTGAFQDGIGGTSVPASRGVDVLGNGWLRFRITAADNNSGNLQTVAQLFGGATTSNYDYYIWGANLTAGSVLYPYLGGQVTCPADVLTIEPGANFNSWHDPAGMTWLVSASRQVVSSSPQEYAVLFNTHNASGNSRMELSYLLEGLSGLYVSSAGVVQAEMYPGATGRKRTIAGRFLPDNFASCANGGALVTDTSGSIPSVDRLRIGNSPTGGFPINGHIHDLLAWPSNSPAGQRLQQLSAALP